MLRKYRLNWDQLLSPMRVNIAVVGGEERISLCNAPRIDSRSPFEKDYCHLIYSSSFRRLGRKTQVHPFATVDYVRCRLTHSLEVSTIAASLLREVVLLFEAEGRHLFHYQDADWVLRTAGLAHDIGNPPYGHAGEKAIKEWASINIKKQEPYFRDFSLYDGNAQSFRILSRNDIRKSLYHNLTVASIGAMVKYPYNVKKATQRHSKFGAFITEEKIFDSVMEHLGLKRGNRRYLRHPLSFLLEAADDISYCLSDLEDGVKMDVLSETTVRELFCQILPQKMDSKCKRRPSSKDLNREGKEIWAELDLEMLRSLVAGVLIKAYSRCFYDYYEEIMHGQFETGKEFANGLQKDVKYWLTKAERLRQKIYKNKNVLAEENQGQKEVSKALTKYMELLKYIIPRSRKPTGYVLSLAKQVLGEDFLEQKSNRTQSWWAHVILDYVVGMTDDFTRRNVVCGIERTDYEV